MEFIGIMKLLNFFRSLFSSPVVEDLTVNLDEITDVYKKLSSEGANGSFAVFMPQHARDGETDVLNIQFSIESDKIGLDWVLISTINISEKEVFFAAAKSMNYDVQTLRMNDVEYFRVEGDRAPDICKQLLANLYNFKHDQKLDLMVEGFEWASAV